MQMGIACNIEQSSACKRHAVGRHVHRWPRVLVLAWACHVALLGCVLDWHTLQVRRAHKCLAMRFEALYASVSHGCLLI